MKEITTEKDHRIHAQHQGAVCLKGDVEGRAAFPDQLILKPDKTFYWIEFKVPGNTLQDDQDAMITLLRAKGQTVYVCDNQEYSHNIIAEEFGL